jgi:hypothetical protein
VKAYVDKSGKRWRVWLTGPDAHAYGFYDTREQADNIALELNNYYEQQRK